MQQTTSPWLPGPKHSDLFPACSFLLPGGLQPRDLGLDLSSLGASFPFWIAQAHSSTLAGCSNGPFSTSPDYLPETPAPASPPPLPAGCIFLQYSPSSSVWHICFLLVTAAFRSSGTGPGTWQAAEKPFQGGGEIHPTARPG